MLVLICITPSQAGTTRHSHVDDLSVHMILVGIEPGDCCHGVDDNVFWHGVRGS